ncbi:MAG: hypothetical protein AB8G96_11450 [Phycisphaerales bacterium]
MGDRLVIGSDVDGIHSDVDSDFSSDFSSDVGIRQTGGALAGRRR